MSKKSKIKELQTEVTSLANDYADAIRQRDSAERTLDKIETEKGLQERAKASAAEQEKVDGIKAGLIPVEELRKHIRETFEVRVNQSRSQYDFHLFFRQGDTNPVSIAIRDAILGEHAPKSFAQGGFFDSSPMTRLTDTLLRQVNDGPFYVS